MLTLEVPLTTKNLRAIDAEVARLVPDSPDRHRRQAVARGLGYDTPDAIRQAASATTPIRAAANGAAFSTHLREQMDVIPHQQFYRAVAVVCLAEVVTCLPDLTLAGMWTGSRIRRADGEWETPTEQRARFVAARQEWANDSVVEQFLHALAFLTTPARKPRGNSGSYDLKHVAERHACYYPEGGRLGYGYISNGVLIAAAQHCGIPFKRKPGVPNVAFQLSASGASKVANAA
jgi:hypothetical protein